MILLRILTVFIFTTAIFVVGCDEEEKCDYVGTVQIGGPDPGCDVLIRTSDKMYEVINADELDFDFVSGQKVRFSYEEVDTFSVCMVGPIVEITCIE